MHCIVQTPTPNIKRSVDFYSNLGFTPIGTDSNKLFTDGGVTIEINEDRFARPGLKIYKDSWSKDLNEIKKHCQITSHKDYELIACPGPCWIYLISEDIQVDKPEQIEKAAVGNFAGMSLETTETKKAFDILSTLGFKRTQGEINSSWYCMEDNNGFSISIMAPNNCPHLFLNPSLNYFNGSENFQNIQRIRDAGISPMEEITMFNKEGIVDNICLRDPGGLGFFVFSD